MGYEDHVYLAKLAEQAERYEGSSYIPLHKVHFTDIGYRDGGEYEERRVRRPRALC